MESPISIDILVDEFSLKLQNHQGVIFVGAGISKAKPTSLPDWYDLLLPQSKELGLTLRTDDDLPLIAQHIVNRHTGNRGPLLQYFREKFINSNPINPYHLALSRTNVRTIWTTNFDNMLEKAFSGFMVDVKSEDDHVSRSVPGHKLEIVKMHGCICNSPFSSIVITSEDYEDFFQKRPAMARRLESDMMNNSVLFIGYGYGDPNIRNIVVEARRLSNKATRRHYMIQIVEDDPDKLARQKLWAKELTRLGIFIAFIKDFGELEKALIEISHKSKGPTVYVTGSHTTTDVKAGEYGKELAKVKDVILLDGQQTSGLCRDFVLGFTEVCRQQKDDLLKRLRIWPNPYAVNPSFEGDESLIPQLKAMRYPLLNSAQVMVAFPGGIGTKAEIEVAKDLGVRILPVPLAVNDHSHLLLKDQQIIDFITKYDPQYLHDAEKANVTPDLLSSFIHKVLSK